MVADMHVATDRDAAGTPDRHIWTDLAIVAQRDRPAIPCPLRAGAMQERAVMDQHAFAWIKALHALNEDVAAKGHLGKAPSQLILVLGHCKCTPERAANRL